MAKVFVPSAPDRLADRTPAKFNSVHRDMQRGRVSLLSYFNGDDEKIKTSPGVLSGKIIAIFPDDLSRQT
jgi:hypothetical protein